MAPLPKFSKRFSLRRSASSPLIDHRDVNELIRISNRLRHRSHAAQRAAARASRILQDVMKRSIEVCGR